MHDRIQRQYKSECTLKIVCVLEPDCRTEGKRVQWRYKSFYEVYVYRHGPVPMEALRGFYSPLRDRGYIRTVVVHCQSPVGLYTHIYIYYILCECVCGFMDVSVCDACTRRLILSKSHPQRRRSSSRSSGSGRFPLFD